MLKRLSAEESDWNEVGDSELDPNAPPVQGLSGEQSLVAPMIAEDGTEEESGESDLDLSNFDTSVVAPPVFADSDDDESEDEDGDEGDEEEDEDDEPAAEWFDKDTKSFLISMGVHVAFILMLGAIPIIVQSEQLQSVLQSQPVAIEEPELTEIDQFAISEMPSTHIGSNSDGEQDMALSMASIVADVSEISTPTVNLPNASPTMDAVTQMKEAVGLVKSKKIVRGMTGVGVSGTDGAIDRITMEILQSIEDRPTLVVWLFDASASLIRRREEIRERFDRIYDELGVAQELRRKASGESEPTEPRLLTSIISFGDKVDLMTSKPISDIKDIRSTIDRIELDSSGNEKTFSAVYLAVEKYKSLRIAKGENGPDRNVLVIAVTDERGDDQDGLDKTIEACRKFAIPVYVMGVPAPFGRDFTYIKYVDPDPKFDQSEQWAQIDQGPETLLPERVQIGFENNFYEEPVIDSGFGPYSISRLCYETGGMYFTIHPNRNYDHDVNRNQVEAYTSHIKRFFDPEVMAKYRPDYLPEAEYMRQVSKSPLRSALVEASKFARTGVLEAPKLVFVKRDEPQLIREVTLAQQESARLEPPLATLVSMLQLGESARTKESSPRWLASFDLSYGTAIAAKVRNETYNLMLAKAKRGMPFTTEKNNTWTLTPSDEVSVSSKLEKEADLARKLLQGVVQDHKGTPWAYLAQRELQNPIGWSWRESYTDLSPPPRMNPAPNNNNNNAPQDDAAKKLKAPPPKRPIPKL